MAGKRPYIPFYVDDFENDRIVDAMTTEQVGAYVLLLCRAWREDPAGSIPDDDATLARWCKLKPQRWAKVKSGILAAFRKNGSRYVQKRLTEEATKLAGRALINAQNGARGGRPPKTQSVISENPVGFISVNETETETKAYAGARAGSEYVFGSESSSKTLPSQEPRGGGSGAGESAEPPDHSPESLAAAWCFAYRGSSSAMRDPYKIASEFSEWIENLGTQPESIRAAIEAKRDRTEPVWSLKERIVARGKKPKPDGSAALAEAIASREVASR